MKKQTLNRQFFTTDMVLLALAAYASFVLRTDSLALGAYWYTFGIFLSLTLIVTPLVFYCLGLYSRYWHYASTDELVLLTGSVTVATTLTSILTLITTWLGQVLVPLPPSVPFIFFLLALAATAGPRLGVQVIARQRRGGDYNHPCSMFTHCQSNQPRLAILIIGAGGAGARIAREMRHEACEHVELVGFVDDDPAKHNLRMYGVPVLGNRSSIPMLVQQHGIRQVIVALPDAPGSELRDILTICRQVSVKTSVLPALHELIDGRLNLSQVRDIQIEDLFRREPVTTDTAAISELLCGKRVLVVGAGGSVGSELCRQVLRYYPEELIMVGRGEHSICHIHSELKMQRALMEWPDDVEPTHLHPIIADIRFASRLQHIFEHYSPDIVFHAAAHKDIPLLEHNLVEAISSNILGTRLLLNAALEAGVQDFIMLSTDEAVAATTIMGASKRVAELLVQQAANVSNARYVTIRLGNILGSRGSVVQMFKQQIAEGGPVTVLHPDMTRCFMTPSEAVQLVFQATALASGGEVFTLDMGTPVRILDLVCDMIALSGLEPGRDIDIVFTGMRPGEPLHEATFALGEHYQPTAHERILLAPNARQPTPPHLHQWIENLAIAAERHDTTSIMLVLQTLVQRPASPPVLPAAAPAKWAPLTEEGGLLAQAVGA